MKLKDQQSFSAENLTKQLQISLRSVLCITTFSPLWRYYININQATSTNQTNTLVYSIMKEGYFHDYKISVQSEEEESQWPTDNQQSLIYIQPRMVCLNQGTIQISVKLFNDFNYILNLPLQKPMQNIISLEDYQPDYYSQNRRKNTQDDKNYFMFNKKSQGSPGQSESLTKEEIVTKKRSNTVVSFEDPSEGVTIICDQDSDMCLKIYDDVTQ